MATDIAGMAERVMRLNQGRGVEFMLAGQGWAMADGAMFHVLENLVSNAIRHAAPTNVRIDIEEKGKKVLVKVTDDGIGIPAEARGRLFQEGFKFGPKGNTGLGLFIVKSIVQRYGGSIWVEENMPKGTVFCIELRKPVSDMPVE
jgi:signal transduction histidine kinase